MTSIPDSLATSMVIDRSPRRTARSASRRRGSTSAGLVVRVARRRPRFRRPAGDGPRRRWSAPQMWMSSMPSRISTAARRPDRWSPGRSTCVMSPVTTTLEPNPSRVRNIFICSAVVFCASSRMMNASLSVRPRMYASGATSITPGRHQLWDQLGIHHVVQRVVERTQVRVDLLAQRAGQKAKPLTGLHRGPGQDDAGDLLGLQRADRLGHGQVGLAGAGRADPEHDGVVVDRVDVALLIERLGPNRLAATRQDVQRQHLGR